MLLKRFRSRKDVLEVISKGNSIRSSGVIIKCIEGKRGYHRLSVICPKSVIKSAVYRNRIKRVFFEAARTILQDIPNALDCIVLIRSDFDYHPKQFNKKSAERVFQAIRIIKARL